MDTRITYQGACVLQALASGVRCGFDVMDFTGLPSGTVYPVLRRFEEHGLLRSEWEDEERARAEGRPRRRNYDLTAEGRAALALAAERLALHRRIFPVHVDGAEAE
jgi:PadR family transcriptional regulator